MLGYLLTMQEVDPTLVSKEPHRSFLPTLRGYHGILRLDGTIFNIPAGLHPGQTLTRDEYVSESMAKHFDVVLDATVALTLTEAI